MARTSNVLTTFVEHPQAIAIVLGHLGSTTQELQRLSKFYTNQNCATIAARCPPVDFLLAQHGRLKPVAQSILNETVSLQRQITLPDGVSNVPIVVHMWSNGGTFLWEELMKHPDLDRVVVPSLQYVAYDSSPCYLHMPWRLSPYWNDAFPFPGWSSWKRKLYLVGSALSLSLWCLLTCSLRRSFDFWTSMRTPLCQHLIYLYSTNDKVTDATRIDELIEEQRSQGKHIRVVRFEDSSHCKLDRDHSDLYRQAIEEAIKGASERAKRTPCA